MPGCLYVVATPIGNLEDMTFRAINVLKSVDAIYCEDTRHTRKLTTHFGIDKPLMSYHNFNEQDRSGEIAERIERGDQLALVSDAGTPLIADPGYRVVDTLIRRGLRVVPVPGASAVPAALSVSGLASDSFYFGGFLPRKSGSRRALLETLRRLGTTLIFYEAPHRILDSLEDIEQVAGNPEVVVCRELTKMHEEILRGAARAVREVLARKPQVLGEFTVLIGKATEQPAATSPAERVHELEQSGLSRMDAIKQVARETGKPKREIYQAVERQPS